MACTIDFRRLDEGFGGKTYKRKRNPKPPTKMPLSLAALQWKSMTRIHLQPSGRRYPRLTTLTSPASGSRATTASSREKSPGGSGSSQGSRGRRRHKLAERGRRSRRGQRRRR
ncbi:hypothetical protein ACFX13_036012 [Malus domestica]